VFGLRVIYETGLMKNLDIHDSEKLRNYLRMEPAILGELFVKVGPMITVHSTKFM